MRARCGSETRARSSSATASSTRSMPWWRRMESASSKSSPRAWTGRTASPSTTARSTSPKAPKFRSSKRSKTISIIRRSPSSSTMSSPTTSRMGGNSSRWDPTTSSTSTSAPCNICLPPETNAQIRRMNLDGSGSEVYVRGVRNSVGFDFHPVTKELYFTDNGRDWLSEDLPNDELNRVTKAGQHFGYPYCHQGTVPDDQFGWGRNCSDYEAPVALLGPHTAALGMRFYTGRMFPAAYRNAIFIARHGSWNKTNKLGGDIIAVKLNPDGSVKSWEPFMTGFLQDNNYIGRPVDVEALKDGSLLVSDDYAGAIYRISYNGRRVAER